MSNLPLAIVSLSVAGSLLAGVLLLLRPLIENRAGRAVSYYLWIIVLLRLCLPFGISLGIPAGWFGGVNSGAPDMLPAGYQSVSGISGADRMGEGASAQVSAQVTDAQPGRAESGLTGGQEISADVDADAGAGVGARTEDGVLAALVKSPGVWLAVWAAGALLCALWYVSGYLRFSGAVKRAAEKPGDADLAVFREFPESGRVHFVQSRLVGTPMLLGLLHPTVVVPSSDYAQNGMAECLRDILRHELTHYRRRDMLYKWFAVAVTCLHWFNPLMILVRREISRACELACDETVIRALSPKQRQHYGDTLLSMAAGKTLPAGILGTTMCEGKARLRERLVSIMDYRTKTWTAAALSVILAAGLLGCAAVRGVEKTESPPQISAQEAVDALEDSLTFSKEDGRVKLTFTVPDYSGAADFDIHINGRMETEDGGMSYHALDDYAGKWEAGEAYDFAPESWDSFTDLLFTADLDGAQPLEIDLLTRYRYSYDAALYEKNGLTVAIPNKYIGRLLVFTEPKFEMYAGTSLISVYERQSYEESLADYGGESGGGFLFGICRYTRAQYEAYLSSDGSGLSFFAKDDTYYYGHTFATDVQFYRSDITSYDEDVFAPWTELSGQVDGILSDFVSRNGLTAYSDSAFWDREFTYDGEHRYVTYYPYYAYNGSREFAYTLVLSQPAKQGGDGIWCVERWYDNDYGNLYYYFPSWSGGTDLAASEYYAGQQSACDGGDRPELKDPVQVSIEFVRTYFGSGHVPLADSFAVMDGEPAGNVLRLCNQVFGDMGTLQAVTFAGDGYASELAAREVPDYYDGPFDSAAASRLHPIVWLRAGRPPSLSGSAIVCRSADAGKTLIFYEQDDLVYISVDGTDRWFKPAYSYGSSPYDRMLAFYEEFSAYDNDAPRHSYSDAEVQAAHDAVYAFFESGLAGCTLNELTYDPARSYEAAVEYLKNGSGKNGLSVDNVIVLYGSFSTDGSQTVLSPNSTYDDYRFVLVRDGTGSAWAVDDGEH